MKEKTKDGRIKKWKGFEAWRILVRENRLQNIGSWFTLRREITKPPRIQSIDEIEQKFNAWEDKIKDYEAYNEKEGPMLDDWKIGYAIADGSPNRHDETRRGPNIR